MKLLATPVVKNALRQEQDALIETNLRLRGYERQITDRLNHIREDYEPEKLKRLKEYEMFVKDLTLRKAKLLQELDAVGKRIEEKKEIYFGMIAKQDDLDEKIYQMGQQEERLKLREAFVVDLETKWREKTE